MEPIIKVRDQEWPLSRIFEAYRYIHSIILPRECMVMLISHQPGVFMVYAVESYDSIHNFMDSWQKG